MRKASAILIALFLVGVPERTGLAGNFADGPKGARPVLAAGDAGPQPDFPAREPSRGADGGSLFGMRLAAAPGPLAADAAGGVVVRRTADLTRFVVTPLTGVFKPGAEVSFYDPAGAFVAKGRVKSYYTDEIYVDAENGRADSISYGFVVGMNLSDAGARDLVSRNRELIASITDQIRDEKAARAEEIGREAKAMEKTRRQEQVDFQRRKMQLDYIYNNYYYRWY